MIDYSTMLFLDVKTTIWEKAADMPPGCSNDVINIDIAYVDTVKNQILEQEIVYVKPPLSKVDAYCELFWNKGISQSKLDAVGIPFSEAYRRLRTHYMSRDVLWGGWGTWEKYAIDKQCKALEMEYPFTQLHTNVERLFYQMTGQVNIRLTDALKHSNITQTDNIAADVANVWMRMASGLRSAVKTRIVVPSQSRVFGSNNRAN
jgi:inhibitor of KinA sporulation pathway (predicted exonuclease)